MGDHHVSGVLPIGLNQQMMRLPGLGATLFFLLLLLYFKLPVLTSLTAAWLPQPCSKASTLKATVVCIEMRQLGDLALTSLELEICRLCTLHILQFSVG